MHDTLSSRLRLCRGTDERRPAAQGFAASAAQLQRGVEIGQVSFVLLILLLERSFRQLEIRWHSWVQALPGYTVGSLGAFWTIQRTEMLLGITP